MLYDMLNMSNNPDVSNLAMTSNLTYHSDFPGKKVNDAANNLLSNNEATLQELNFFELSHGELPDIVAYSKQKNWLYLIEAVHSSGSITEFIREYIELIIYKIMVSNKRAEEGL